MRIFFVTNNYTPYSGGVVSSIDALVRGLQEDGHEVFVVTLDFLGNKHHDPDYVLRLPCFMRFMYRKNYMAVPWRPTKHLLNLCVQYKPDIIHVHHPFLLGKCGLRVARRLKIPCIFTYHTIYEDYAHYVPVLGRLAKPLINFLVTRFCHEVDGIVAPSFAIKNILCTRGIRVSVVVVPSPLRAQFFEKQKEMLPKIQKEWFDLLVVSRFVPEKNIVAVFAVLMLLPTRFRLTLAGYGVEYEAIQEYAFNRLNLSHERVRFIHKPTQLALLELYQSADLFIFTSKTDTQGLVMAEAMSQGLPVIAFDGPGQRDIIRNAENGFIVENPEQAANIIRRISNDDLAHKVLQTNALKTAYSYNPRVLINRIVAFYDNILNNYLR